MTSLPRNSYNCLNSSSPQELQILGGPNKTNEPIKMEGIMENVTGIIIRVLCGVAELYFVGIALFGLLVNSWDLILNLIARLHISEKSCKFVADFVRLSKID